LSREVIVAALTLAPPRGPRALPPAFTGVAIAASLANPPLQNHFVAPALTKPLSFLLCPLAFVGAGLAPPGRRVLPRFIPKYLHHTLLRVFNALARLAPFSIASPNPSVVASPK
jgi:hypothetical protein